MLNLLNFSLATLILLLKCLSILRGLPSDVNKEIKETFKQKFKQKSKNHKNIYLVIKIVYITNPHTRHEWAYNIKKKKMWLMSSARRGRVLVAPAVPVPLSSCRPRLPYPRPWPRFVILIVVVASVSEPPSSSSSPFRPQPCRRRPSSAFPVAPQGTTHRGILLSPVAVCSTLSHRRP